MIGKMNEMYQGLVSSLDDMKSYCRALEEDLAYYENDNEVRRAIDRQLHIDSKETMMEIWDLEEEFKVLHDSRLDLWTQKESRIGQLKQKLEELQVRPEIKTQCLEDTAAQLLVYDGVLNDSMFIAEQEKGNYAHSMALSPRRSVTNSAPDTESNAEHELVTKLYSGPENPSEYEVDEQSDVVPCQSEEPMISDVVHLYQLKVYLQRKISRKTFGKKLEPVVKAGLIKALLTFCDTLLGGFTNMGQLLDDNLNLSSAVLTEKFGRLVESNLENEPNSAEPVRKCMKYFQALLCKFSRKYPFLEKTAGSGFLGRIFKKKPERNVMEDTSSGLLKEKLFLKEAYAKSARDRLAKAKTTNDFQIRNKGLLEENMEGLRVLLQDAKDNLVYDKETFDSLHRRQDHEIRGLEEELCTK